MKSSTLPVIGSLEPVEICGREAVPAKIDTGADSSSIWASDIEVTKTGELKFKLFDKASEFYTGKTITRKDFKVAVVRSATGEEQIRYRTYFSIKIAGKKIHALLNLSDRSNNNFPILIGRRTISGRFLVDVSKSKVERPSKNLKTSSLSEELKKDPYKFHQKYVKLAGKGTVKA